MGAEPGGRPLFRLVTGPSVLSVGLAVAVTTCFSSLSSSSLSPSLELSLSLLLLSSLDSSELFFSSLASAAEAPFTAGLVVGAAAADDASSFGVRVEEGGVAPGRRGLMMTRFAGGWVVADTSLDTSDSLGLLPGSLGLFPG